MLGRIIRERVSSNCLPSPNLAPWAAAELLAALSAAGSKRSMHTTTMESLSLHARGFQAPARASVRRWGFARPGPRSLALTIKTP